MLALLSPIVADIVPDHDTNTKLYDNNTYYTFNLLEKLAIVKVLYLPKEFNKTKDCSSVSPFTSHDIS